MGPVLDLVVLAHVDLRAVRLVTFGQIVIHGVLPFEENVLRNGRFLWKRPVGIDAFA